MIAIGHDVLFATPIAAQRGAWSIVGTFADSMTCDRGSKPRKEGDSQEVERD